MNIQTIFKGAVNVVIGVFVLLVTWYWLGTWYPTKHDSFTTFTGEYQGVSTDRWNSHLKHNDINVPDSIGYNAYNRLHDSIVTTRDLRDNNFLYEGDGSFASIFGLRRAINCDTCSLSWFYKAGIYDTSKRAYFILLPGWKITAGKKYYLWGDSDIFKMSNNRYILNPDEPYYKKANPQYNRPRDVRYSKQDECVMIPVSKTAYGILKVSFLITGIAFLILTLFLISSFINFTLDLAKGLSFTAQNIKRLKRIAYALLALPLFVFVLNLFLRLLFNRYLDDDVELNPEIWADTWKIIAVGVLFYALFEAFRQGKKLKDEQDLTV